MKLADIHIGNAYNTKNGAVVVIDKGPFSATTNSDQVHVVHWRSLQFVVGRSWYYRNPDERTRVVIVDMNRDQVRVLAGSALHQEITEEAIKAFCEQSLMRVHSAKLRNSVMEHKSTFEHTLTSLFLEFTDTEPLLSYTEKSNPYHILLRRPEFLNSLLTLWLRVLTAQNVEIRGRQPVDVLSEFEDILSGLRQVQQRDARLLEDIQQTVNEQLLRTFNSPLRLEAA